jgi:NTP pyrophosphatase (non-canonical NTP hydrolase)
MSTTPDMQKVAHEIAIKLHENGWKKGDVDAQILMLAEEVGEVIGAYRRATGRARRTDTMEHVHEELADVIIGAYVVAHEMNFDLNQAIDDKLAIVFSRGWRDNVNAS